MKWIYLLLSLFLFSCSASYHLEKAKKKGAKIETQIVKEYVTRTDTIIDTLTNTKEIRVTIIDTVEKEINSIKYIPLSRQERLKYKDSLKHEREMYDMLLSAYKDSLKNSRQITRLNNKKANRSEKNAVKMERAEKRSGFFWFFAGFITCFFMIAALYIYFKLYSKDCGALRMH